MSMRSLLMPLAERDGKGEAYVLSFMQGVWAVQQALLQPPGSSNLDEAKR